MRYLIAVIIFGGLCFALSSNYVNASSKSVKTIAVAGGVGYIRVCFFNLSNCIYNLNSVEHEFHLRVKYVDSLTVCHNVPWQKVGSMPNGFGGTYINNICFEPVEVDANTDLLISWANSLIPTNGLCGEVDSTPCGQALPVCCFFNCCDCTEYQEGGSVLQAFYGSYNVPDTLNIPETGTHEFFYGPGVTSYVSDISDDHDGGCECCTY